MKLCRYIFVMIAPVWAQVSPTINDLPSREFGQVQLDQQLRSLAPNLVEGREFTGPSSIAFDTSVSPPILYVADAFNHRVLAWRNPGSLGVCGIATSSVRTPTNNGCGYADLAIGQRDLFSTNPQGPGATFSTGFSFPSAVAVDGNGNLYVADSGNNRILRFPKPFAQSSSILQPDLVIGQANVNQGVQPNQGLPTVNATMLFLAISHSNRIGPVGLALDSSGNLWVPDLGNNRVLRFPSSQLAPNTSLPAADVALGQFGLTCPTSPCQALPAPQGTATQLYNQSVAGPVGLAFDANGRLYVADLLARVLYYPGPFSTGLIANRILGVNLQPTQQNPQPPAYPNQYTLGNITNGSLLATENGVFTLGNNLYVADTAASRIVKYDIPDNWPASTALQPSPAVIAVLGQNDMVSGKANKGLAQPDATTLNGPLTAAFNGTEMWVADSFNHRVLAFPQQNGSYGTASRVVGQLDFPFNTPNLIEGREVFFFSGTTGSAGIVIDTKSDPPHLYVADTFNNRVLGFKDARTVQQGSIADLVIGQPDVFRSVANYPSGISQQPSDTGLFGPIGLVVEANGDLYVADQGNGRVVRFPAPFSQPAGALQHANLVLGQTSFTFKIQNASQQNMGAPFGLAFFSDSNGTTLYVSDSTFNRVLTFKHATGADFQNGQVATAVLGQSNFTSTIAGAPTSASGMNHPSHIATDTSDRLYVCDTSNNRVMAYTDARNQPNGASSVLQIPNLSQPTGVTVSQITGEIWITNTNSQQVLRFPEFQTLQSTVNPQPSATLSAPVPLAVALDAVDNVLVADASNRVTFFFAKLAVKNAFTFNEPPGRPLAPGMVALLGRLGRDFSLTSNTAQTLPWPPTMSDIQVFVNGTAAPIYAVFTTGMNIMVPSNAPVSGNADFIVMRKSTGEILAAASIPMAQANPGFKSADGSGQGAILATNFDQAVANCTPQPACFTNGPTNPVGVGKEIIFCLTGQGVVPGSPPDGSFDPATDSKPLPVQTVVIINGTPLNSSQLLYSGLGCGYPGLWQINALVPLNVAPGNNIPVVVTLYDIQSNVADVVQNGQVLVNQLIRNTISVK